MILVEYFVQALRQSGGQKYSIDSTRRRWICLQSYDWPGNIRELQNVMVKGPSFLNSYRCFFS